MKYAYLSINALTIFFPLILSFDNRVRFYKSWRSIWPGMLITALVFLGWDVLFTLKGVWSFNDHYIIGIRLFQLPLEELLFFITVPFACIFIYECLRYYVKWESSNTTTKTLSLILMIGSLMLAVIYHQKWYTVVTFGLLFVLMALYIFVLRVTWLNRFYMAFVVCLIPFYVVNGVLTAVPIVLYNNAQNMSLRVGTIPFEDHFYLMSLLLMNVGFFEYFRRKGAANG